MLHVPTQLDHLLAIVRKAFLGMVSIVQVGGINISFFIIVFGFYRGIGRDVV
jgi:hypothetical protein